jgi:hypothetical protein
MNWLKTKSGLVSLASMLPALFFIGAGILYVGFDVEPANRWLDALTAHAVFKLLLSPVVVLGGPMAAFALNVWKVFHVSADIVNDEFVIAISVRRMLGHLLWLALAGGLMLLLGAYVLVENFMIVAR